MKIVWIDDRGTLGVDVYSQVPNIIQNTLSADDVICISDATTRNGSVTNVQITKALKYILEDEGPVVLILDINLNRSLSNILREASPDLNDQVKLFMDDPGVLAKFANGDFYGAEKRGLVESLGASCALAYLLLNQIDRKSRASIVLISSACARGSYQPFIDALAQGIDTDGNRWVRSGMSAFGVASGNPNEHMGRPLEERKELVQKVLDQGLQLLKLCQRQSHFRFTPLQWREYRKDLYTKMKNPARYCMIGSKEAAFFSPDETHSFWGHHFVPKIKSGLLYWESEDERNWGKSVARAIVCDCGLAWPDRPEDTLEGVHLYESVDYDGTSGALRRLFFDRIMEIDSDSAIWSEMGAGSGVDVNRYTLMLKAGTCLWFNAVPVSQFLMELAKGAVVQMGCRVMLKTTIEVNVKDMLGIVSIQYEQVKLATNTSEPITETGRFRYILGQLRKLPGCDIKDLATGKICLRFSAKIEEVVLGKFVWTWNLDE